MDLQIEIRSSCAYITICDRTTRNSLSASRVVRLRTLLEGFAKDYGIRGVCIRGEGDVFCSGHNLHELREVNPQSAPELFGNTSELAQYIRAMELPVLACVNGPAIGAGVQLALAADCIIAARESYFQTPGGARGWFCFTPAVELMQRVPAAVAREMLFSGVALDAERAFQLGIVNEVVATSELMDRCDTFFQGIIRGDREMIARGKALANQNAAHLMRPLYEQASGLMATTLFTTSAQRRIQPKID